MVEPGEVMYADDLAYIHHTGFGTFARDAAPGLLAHLRDAGLESGLVVDLACGTGIWARELLAAGYDVLGIDISPAMIAMAAEIVPAGEFREGSVHAVEIPTCVAVTVISEGIGYLAADGDPIDLTPLLRRAHAALVPGGLLVFDVVETSVGDPMRYESSRTGDDWSVTVDVLEDPESARLTRRITTTRVDGDKTRTASETHVIQTFTRAELESTLREANFDVRLVDAYGELALPPHRIGVVARKPKTPRPHPSS